ncbi:MAG: hypothetical protein RL189_528 [Pseudomonadota bacterium]|jgi:hypothetical protein
MDLVEQELNWVLNSPMFFAPSASTFALAQCPAGMTPSLPGPITHPNEMRHLTTAESCGLLSDVLMRNAALAELRSSVPTLASGRLGIRFELYVETILRNAFGSQNVQTRVAVREPCADIGVKTWGEFDFLFFNQHQQRVEHWETSVKFYLQVRDEPQWKWCWGPGIIDRLDLKGPKTFLQQLALSSTDLGYAAIPSAWQVHPLVKSVFAKGTIFYRWSVRNESFSERLMHIVQPQALAADHQKSWWVEPDDVRELQAHYPGARVALLPRIYWMTGLPQTAQLSTVTESWNDFNVRLEARLAAASARNECLFIGIYNGEQELTLSAMGFVATPRFLHSVAG